MIALGNVVEFSVCAGPPLVVWLPSLASSAGVKLPPIMPGVGTVTCNRPVSSVWKKYSNPVKKNSLSLFLFRFVPGMTTGPLSVPPGK